MLFKKESLRPLVFLLLGMAFFYLLYHSFAGGTLFAWNCYDSYSIQAENWLAGHTYLSNGAQYTWLEIAYYDGQYYLSFPAVPSVLLLPWVILCGGASSVPANFIIACIGILTALGVYLLFCNIGASVHTALFWSLFVTMGSNTCWLSTSGGVWFMAQMCNLCFVIWGILCASFSSKAGNICAAACLALAVGCRPFSIVILALFFLWIWVPELKKNKHPLRWGSGFWPALCIAAAVGGALAWYNWIRFGSIFEFGHNYLPEFIEATNGQFHLSYFWSNLKGLFSPITLTDNLVLSFSLFNGFFLFAANPIFLLWGIHTLSRIVQQKFTWREAVLWLCCLLGLAFLCLHKTMGGWQFGARYMVDLIPYVLLCSALPYCIQPHAPAHLKKHTLQYLHSGNPQSQRNTPADWEWFLLVLAVMFNVYGAVYMLF